MTSQNEKSLTQSPSQLNDLSQSRNRTQSTVRAITTVYPLKITFVGDSSVGKTSLIAKYCEEKFNPEGTNPTISVGILEKNVKIDSLTEAKLSIWDTAGSEKYLSFTASYLRESNGIIIVFDFTNEKSFKDLDMWVDLINDSVGFEKVVKILVGNKSDLPDRKINEEEAKHYAGEHGMKFIKVSAKEGVNIDYLFEVVANDCVKNLLQDKNQKENNKDKNDNEEKINMLGVENNNKNNNDKKKRKCC